MLAEDRDRRKWLAPNLRCPPQGPDPHGAPNLDGPLSSTLSSRAFDRGNVAGAENFGLIVPGYRVDFVALGSARIRMSSIAAKRFLQCKAIKRPCADRRRAVLGSVVGAGGFYVDVTRVRDSCAAIVGAVSPDATMTSTEPRLPIGGAVHLWLRSRRCGIVQAGRLATSCRAIGNDA